jgi:RNA polymerase sigma factor (TIGR02999 family)
MTPKAPRNPGDGPSCMANLHAEELLPQMYDDLRRLAASRVATMASGDTLQATALVHEAWLQLAGRQRAWRSRTHFFATTAQIMRHILIDHLRNKARLKRGKGQLPLNIDDFDLAQGGPDEKVLLIDEALQQLEKEYPEKARVVVLKFFGGLTDCEVAEELGLSERTIERHWAYAKAWLLTSIRKSGGAPCRV